MARFARFETDGQVGEEYVFRVLSSTWDRLKGLLLTREDAFPVVLMRCSSVHTYGMSYAIDLAFVEVDGGVLRVERSVQPGRVLAAKGASCVFERPVSDEPWFVAGERIKALGPVTA